ncbi:MAG TPA: S8 family serine peptidase [Pilimelia sp.]|nr:S8 family serine peptidase [Pilimelia sp.]
MGEGRTGPAAPVPSTYTVVAADGVSPAAAAAAIAAAGGTVVADNTRVGTYQVVSRRADFAARAGGSRALVGAVPQRPVGVAPRLRKDDPVERLLPAAPPAARAAAPAPAPHRRRPAGMDPLDTRLWGLTMVRSDLARQKEAGSREVTVGVMDTGLDASHPDLAPNFDARRSRNFAPDIEAIDGPCEVRGCVDPVGTDDGGHGTHVAGSIAAAANGAGLSGVAPNVTLVELKAGQDSGFFFLDSVVNSLTYAGDAGLDVVNMSFYVDPWAFNCPSNPADSPEQQAQQRATIKAMTRALNYAHRKGVTLVGALGNAHLDLGNPGTDATSPNYPDGAAHDRVIDNATCLDLPVEGAHVIGVSSLGPSTRKSDYSNYGVEQISVAAPGGFSRDYHGTPEHNKPENLILSTYPKKVLLEEKKIDADGNVTPGNEARVFKECADGVCGYYTYLQGTSMASPYAAGVTALIVSRFGTRDSGDRGLTMKPALVEQHLYRTAAERPCPKEGTVVYPQPDGTSYSATCTGTENFNGFYGHGIVDAYAAVTQAPKPKEKP